jgi:hypothetical protein
MDSEFLCHVDPGYGTWAESVKREPAIKANLKGLGYGE